MVSVYLFVPNLIGYARVATAIAAYYYCLSNPTWFLALYAVSFVADAADGMAARALGQCSRFGAILDMITDRAATCGLLVLLATLLGPHTAFPAALLVGLDITSHMARMYSSLALGDESHKSHVSPFWFLNIYYTNRKVMGATCVGQEFLYLALYAQHWWPQVQAITYAVYVLAPLFALKQWANFEQLLDGLMRLAAEDEKARKTR